MYMYKLKKKLGFHDLPNCMLSLELTSYDMELGFSDLFTSYEMELSKHMDMYKLENN